MINLTKSGEGISLEKKDLEKNVSVKMLWKSAIDLDLHAKVKSKRGKTAHIYHASKGNISNFPFTKLDKDAGIGDSAGDNEENMNISKLEELSDVLLYVQNYSSDKSEFAQYGARLRLKFDTKEVEVDLNDKTKGKYFVIARIKDEEVTCINRTVTSEPRIEDVDSMIGVERVVEAVGEVASDVARKGKGFLRRIGQKLSNL